MYLLSRKIKAMGVKMVLSGEGSDEVFGGMLSFHYQYDNEVLIIAAMVSRLSLLPCRPRPHIVPPRDCSSCQEPPYF